jgi:multicomponent K+:H+ antiporter subunit A
MASLAVLATLLPDVFNGRVPAVAWAWVPSLGLHLSFRLDGLALLFALLILGIGLLVILYARYYMHERDPLGRLYALLLLFMGSMTGLVLAGNLLLMAVFWELTSVSSFLLIAYWTRSAGARRAARMALAVTGGGGLALLGGLLLLGKIAGSFELTDVLAAGDRIVSDPLYLPMLGLVLLGAFTKSAQLPFHFWLPEAMAAPTPVSAYLHSATMVKAGIFLLARLHPAIAGGPGWFPIVSGVGLATLVVGAYLAIHQADLKGLLAYSTISHLGLITFLLGLATPLASVAAVFHVINHATFKASLFMAAGIIDHETGTRDMRVLNGLARHMPYTAVLAIVAAAAMAGVPLLNGFLSKEMFFEEALAYAGGWRWAIVGAATLGAGFSVTYSIRFIHQVFFAGSGTGLPKEPHEPVRWMRLPVEVLAALCLVVGLFPAFAVSSLLRVAAEPVVGGRLPGFSLAIWHGWTPALLMTIIALAGGSLLYRILRDRLDTPVIQHLARTRRLAWSATMRGLQRSARATTAGLEQGGLRRSLVLLVAAVLLLGSAPGWEGGWITGTAEPGAGADPVSIVVWLMLVLSSLLTVVLHHRRFETLVALGVVGLVVTLAFVRFSAPDLALTQLLVETVTILLLLLALYYLPRQATPSSSRPRRLRDAALAALVGLGGTGLTWLVLTRPQNGISSFFTEQSKPAGGGTNIVNVILVDFRGFDTFGEITVLAIAALGISALLAGLTAPSGSDRGNHLARDRHPTILATVSRPMLPLMLLLSIYLLFRGHNLPGGGFIAGLLTGAALILQYVANGTEWTLARLGARFSAWVACGVFLALATGLGAWAFESPFLSMTFTYVELPLVGRFELATALLFDLGVYVTVVGAVMLILTRFGLLRTTDPDQALTRPEDPWQP